MRKMEESLKRLKQARKGASMTSTAGANGGPTDDSKIRLQLALDVEYLGEQVGCGWRDIIIMIQTIHIYLVTNVYFKQMLLKLEIAPSSVKNSSEMFLIVFSSQIEKMGFQPSDISMFTTLMDLVKEARELAEQ